MQQNLPISIGPGCPDTLGVTETTTGFNFAVYGRDAKQIFIHLFLPDTEEFVCKIELKNRTRHIFYGEFSGIDRNWLYAVQAIQRDDGNSAINDKLLIDPYAKSLNRPQVWQRVLYESNSPFFVSKAHLSVNDFNWQGVEKPNIPNSQTILYETHVKGFTQLHPEVPEKYRGSYLGLVQPAVIQYLQDLGVTSVQLMPVFSFMSEPRLEDLGLTNYWGYNPVNFFAPEPRYAIKDPVIEFKTLVRELHKHNIEVILDVVFNHTAESGRDGVVLSFKGLADLEFYMRADDGYCFDYANYTGCGNTVNVDSDFGIKIIMDSLRYWLTEMQVDGFRFDLAATLGRINDRFNPRATLFRAMAQDPIISRAKLIAEPWDIGPSGYQLGNFPRNWLECNDRYRDGIRKFWRGDRGMVAETASRILGSRDIFQKGKRSQISSINYICYHDGFTLEDLVSYEHRHNFANLEHNRDGHGENYSSNYGVEGETTDLAITSLRQKQKRNMLATLLFSQGVPHLLAGDEICRSQQGNNNAYCQDNEISWLNWQMDVQKRELLAFTRYCIELRRCYPIIQQCFLIDDKYQTRLNHHKVKWIRPDGESKQIDDWHNHENQCLAVLLTEVEHAYSVLLILNASKKRQEFKIPKCSEAHRLVDTSLLDELTKTPYHDKTYLQQGQSLSLWQLYN